MHGLSATKLLPQVVSPGAFEHLLARLTDEFCPATPTQEFLVRELARHGAMLDVAEKAEAAVLRTAAAAAADLRGDSDAANANSAEAEDFQLTAAVASEAVDRLTRYRRPHEKAWLQAFRQLQELRMRAREPAAPPLPPFSFTEGNCMAFLRKRFQAPDWRCQGCANADGHWLPSRRRWQCSKCARQIGLRSGTVMQRSPLPLAAWFTAIWTMLLDREVSIDELSTVTKIARRPTVNRMRDQIASALVSPDRSLLLAGLDQFDSHKPRGVT